MAEQTATPASGESAAQATPAKKTSAKKSTAKKTTTKKTAAKKTATKKTAATKSTAKKATAKKSTAKKSTAKKTPAKRTAKTATARDAAKKTVGRVAATTTATGKAVVAKAAAATRKPVEAVRAPSAALLTSALSGAQARAKQLSFDPSALRTLADQALHSETGRTGPLGEVADEFKTLGRLVAAYARGDYRDIPLDSLAMVVAGLVYVVSPIDLIPEAIPVAGLADDAVAVGFVIRQVHHELTAFREWEAEHRPA